MTGPLFPPPDSLLRLVMGARRLWLVTHENPDPDGMGSLLGLGLALRRAGRDVAMLRHEDSGDRFRLLPGLDETTSLRDAMPDPEAVVLLDCHEIGRLGVIADRIPRGSKIAVIDHHVASAQESGPSVWIEPSAPATTCLVHSFVRAAPQLTLTEDVANCLYAGLLTDTGGFRFSNTSAQALAVASDLVANGADASWLAEELLHRQTPESLRLLSRMLDSLNFVEEGRVAFMELPRRLLRETGAADEEAEGFINFATAVRGVAMVALFREESSGNWRLSLRANGDHDVQSIALQFNGGGHRKAAGCTVVGELPEVQARVLAAMQQQLGPVT